MQLICCDPVFLSRTPEHEASLQPLVEGSEPDEPGLVLADLDLHRGQGFHRGIVPAVYDHESFGLGFQQLYRYPALLGDDDAPEVAVWADGR